MSTTLEQLKNVIADLTLEERTELANFLADSIDQGGARMGMLKLPGITSLPAEPTRYEAAAANGKPAEVVFAELREKYQ